MQQLSGQDASFVYTETPNAPMHVGSLMVYNPAGQRITFKGILAMLDARLHLAPVLRRRLVARSRLDMQLSTRPTLRMLAEGIRRRL